MRNCKCKAALQGGLGKWRLLILFYAGESLPRGPHSLSRVFCSEWSKGIGALPLLVSVPLLTAQEPSNPCLPLPHPFLRASNASPSRLAWRTNGRL